MPSTGSVVTALIAAGALILGVIITNWQQNRREERTWQRQFQIYAQQWDDQQKRDQGQREDQRERDRESFDREDRHRFTEIKREVYSDILTMLQQTTSNLSRAISVAKIEKERRIKTEETLDKPGFRQLIKLGHPEIYEQIRSHVDSPSTERGSLIAPLEVMLPIRQAHSELFGAALLLLTEGDIEGATDGLKQGRTSVNKAREAMRTDLSASPTASSR